MSNFVQDFAVKLMGKVSDEDLAAVIKALELHCTGYSIEEKTKELVPYTDFIPKCYQAYIADRIISGYSKKTLYHDKLFLEDMFKSIHKPIEDITDADIKIYLFNLQQTRNLSNISLENRRCCLSTFFKWCNSAKYIPDNPMVMMRAIKCENKPRVPLSDLELESIRKNCKTTREKAIIEVLYSTGCRIAELINLNWNDIDIQMGKVHLFGKGKKHRISYLTAKAKLILEDYRKEHPNSEAVFVSEKTKKRLSCRSVQSTLADLGERSGLDRRLHPHLIRHTTATNLLKHGMDIVLVQKILGHEKTDTTLIYAHIDDSRIQSDHLKYIA